MKYLDCVKLIVEKEKYAKHGVHEGMQGIIFDERNVDGNWLVLFPRYGEKADIADIPVLEVDLELLPNGFDSVLNEEIEERFKNG